MYPVSKKIISSTKYILLQTKKKYEKVLLKKMLKKPNNIVGVDVNVNKQLHHINFLYKEKDIITKNNCTKEEQILNN